jgi:hypothetical protein
MAMNIGTSTSMVIDMGSATETSDVEKAIAAKINPRLTEQG